MNNFIKSNSTKKFWSILFTLCMLITNFAYLPINIAYASLNHDIKIIGYEKIENEEFIYSMDGFKVGSLKLEGNLKTPENEGYTYLENGNYKVIINVSNGYSFNNLKINDENHSAKELNALNNNTYSYNLQLNSNMKDLNLEAEFNSNVLPNSQRKIYIGDAICIDESLETPITHYSDSNCDIFPSETLGSYTMNIKPNASIGNIITSEGTDLIIKAQEDSRILSKDGFSIKGVRNLSVYDDASFGKTLSLEGGIEALDLIYLNKNISINNSEAKGIVGASKVFVEHSRLSINTNFAAFENIKDGIYVSSNGKLEIKSNESALQNVGKIMLNDGGKTQIESKSSELPTKVYSSQNNLEEGKISEEIGVSVKKEINWTETSEEAKRENNYLCSKSESPNENGYYIWNAESLSPPTNKFIYGQNVVGESLSLVQGDVEIISATGIKQDKNSNTKSGAYNIKSGSEITLKLTPRYGYQLNKNILKNAVPQEEKCVYKFTMPNENIYLDNIFVKTQDKTIINSDSIKNVSINIPENTILGNAYLTINRVNSLSDEEKFKSKAGNFNISEYVDILLEEVIFKNGDENQGVWKTNITKLNNPIDIKLELNSELKGKKKYCVLREHEGEVDMLKGIYMPKDEMLKFTTDRFSVYTVGSDNEVRTLTSTVKYKNNDLKIIVEDPNDALNDNAELAVELVEKETNPERYKTLESQLDDTHKVEKVAFFDIFIYKDSKHQEKYSQLDQKVNVFFEIPEGWDKNDLQAVLVADGVDGEFEEEVVKKEDKDYLSFWTDHFSPYSFIDTLSDEDLKDLGYDDNEDYNLPEDKEPEITDETNDNLFNMVTGDRSRNLIIYAAVAIAISLVAILILKKKNNKQ